jgi:hypothetical protein
MWNVQIGVRMREIRLLQDLHAGWTGLTGAHDRSDRCPPDSKPDWGVLIDQACKRISLWGKTSPPYKCKGPRPIEGDNAIESIIIVFTFSFLFSLTFPTLPCCSYFISVMFEDVLAALPRLGQPCVRRPDGIPPRRRSLVSRRIFPATTVWPVTRTGLTGAAWRRCKELLCMLVGV